MNATEPTPPRWAEAALRSLLRPSDRDAISGDLLEEYREIRHPALGALGANAWYVKHMLSVLWRLIWPFSLALAGLTILSFKLRGIHLWYGSLLPAPGLSLVHALIYLWVGYYASQRTRLIRTGMLTAGVTGFIGCTVFFVSAAAMIPGLIIVSFSMPFTFFILSVYHLLALSYGVLVGTVGGAIGRRVANVTPWKHRVS